MMMMTEISVCPICELNAKKRVTKQNVLSGVEFDCVRCGRFVLGYNMPTLVKSDWLTTHRRSVLSHLLRRQQRADGKPVEVASFELGEWHLDDPLPSPAEQAEQLILWIGRNQRSPAEPAKISASAISAMIGVALIPIDSKPFASNRGLDWLLMQSELKPFIEVDVVGPEDLVFSLTMGGWNRYEAIKRQQVISRTAFMAMKFDD